MTDDGGSNYERCGTEDSTGDRDGCVEACEERSTGDHFAEDCDADDAADGDLGDARGWLGEQQEVTLVAALVHEHAGVDRRAAEAIVDDHVAVRVRALRRQADRRTVGADAGAGVADTIPPAAAEPPAEAAPGAARKSTGTPTLTSLPSISTATVRRWV